MKAIQCEMCGSNDVLKDGEYYVCQHCGTKYTAEAAKKLMVEGTVKIDTSETTRKYLQLARRAKETKDNVNAAKYYSLVAEECPDDWESTFYSTYFSCFDIKNGEIGSAALLLKNKLETIGKMVFALEGEERKKAAIEVTDSLITVSFMLDTASVAYLHSLPTTMIADEKVGADYRARTVNISEIPLIWGNILYDNAETDSTLRKKCVVSYKAGITIIANHHLFEGKTVYHIFDEAIRMSEHAANRIREVEPEFQIKREKPTNENGKSGCYVATCVYGSYDCPQVWTLRRYRDNTLGSTWYGRLFIKLYYAISPTLVKWFGKTKWFKKLWQGKLDRMVKKLNEKGVENTPYQDKQW